FSRKARKCEVGVRDARAGKRRPGLLFAKSAQARGRCPRCGRERYMRFISRPSVMRSGASLPLFVMTTIAAFFGITIAVAYHAVLLPLCASMFPATSQPPAYLLSAAP